MYDDILREKYDRVDPRLADLDQLESIAGGYADRSSFLVAAALEPPSSTQDLAGESDEETDTLVLSTCHSAKGKEWKAVFVIWCVDGWFPSTRSLGDDDELEEERRLMYVAMTRAKDHLMATYPVHVYSTRRGADYSIDQLSRFLDRGVQQTMQKVVIAAAEAPRPADPLPAPGVIDLRALLRGRFGG
jgi:DNA helicase-2/ATP-dependent DNA helicase PcrA